MTEQEAVAYIEEWDVVEAAKVLKWYENDELLRPCDCDTIVAIETEDLRAENAKLRELVDYMTPIAWYAASERERDRMRELGVES